MPQRGLPGKKGFPPSPSKRKGKRSGDKPTSSTGDGGGTDTLLIDVGRGVGHGDDGQQVFSMPLESGLVELFSLPVAVVCGVCPWAPMIASLGKPTNTTQEGRPGSFKKKLLGQKPNAQTRHPAPIFYYNKFFYPTIKKNVENEDTAPSKQVRLHVCPVRVCGYA